MLDQVVLGTVFWVLAPLIVYSVAPTTWLRIEGYMFQPWFALVERMSNIAVLVPINAILIGLARTTPGKLLFGVRIERPDGQRIGFPAALWRELKVWVTGYGLAIPILSWLTMWNAKTEIEAGGASWDRQGGHHVYYRPEGSRQTVFAVIGILVIVVGIIGLQVLSAWADQMPA